MTSYKFANNAQTTLAADASAGATSITVASATGFPASGDFTIIVDSEIMLVTGVAGAVWTVARAQEGTSATSHTSGATVVHILTAAFLNGLVSGAAGTSFPASPANGDRFFRTDRGIEYFYDSTLTKWLSVHLHTMHGPLAEGWTTAGAGTLQKSGLPLEAGQDIYLVAMTNVAMVQTTNNGSNYWSAILYKHDGSSAVQVVAFTTSAYAPNVYNRFTLTIGTVIPASSQLQLFCLVSSTGTPGALFLYGSKITYRLVG